jgi:hypothetical protein
MSLCENKNNYLLHIQYPSGAKARVDFAAFAARLKSCPDAKLADFGVLPQPSKRMDDQLREKYH